MNIEVGAYEAKTKLPELLHGVQIGKCYTITLRGETVADLVAVPSLWALETANVVAKLEAKELLSEADAQRFIALVGRLNIVTDQAMAAHALGDTLHLARRYRLPAYDAAYLELALRTGLPLATRHADLAKAAASAGVAAFAVD